MRVEAKIDSGTWKDAIGGAASAMFLCLGVWSLYNSFGSHGDWKLSIVALFSLIFGSLLFSRHVLVLNGK